MWSYVLYLEEWNVEMHAFAIDIFFNTLERSVEQECFFTGIDSVKEAAEEPTTKGKSTT